MNYDNLTWYSQERKEHYRHVNSSKEKQIGDSGEEIAKQWFTDRGYSVKESNSHLDSTYHIDFYVFISGAWKSVDVKYKKDFVIELVNNWSNPGWIYTGADYIFQIFQSGSKWNTNEGYIYKRTDMVNFINQNRGLFSDKYCERKEMQKFGKCFLQE